MSTSALLEVAEARPAVEVQEVEYRRLLGYPKDHELTGRALELSDWARSWYAEHGRPWWYARQAARLELGEGGGGCVTIDGTAFGASRLRDQLVEAGATSAVLVAVGAGGACEREARRLWEEGKPDEYFFLEVYGSAVVEALVAAAAFRLCEWADAHGMAALPHYSPGYPDWSIADQGRLRDLIGLERHRDLPEGVRVLESGMLDPKKSLLAVFGLTRDVASVQRLTSLIPCTGCSLRGCRYRRAPYRHAPPALESAQPAGGAATESGAAPARAVLTGDAEYSTSPAVLERWSKRRLELHFREDGTIEARFRYDGTTCSNMGQPLAFEYAITLTSREEGYRIIEARCAPATDDIGHTFMCEYLADPQALMRAIAVEAPLLGRPLDEVLTWQHGQGPAGCYCDAGGREHKWGLAYETLHYALSRDPRLGVSR